MKDFAKAFGITLAVFSILYLALTGLHNAPKPAAQPKHLNLELNTIQLSNHIVHVFRSGDSISAVHIERLCNECNK